MKKLPEGHKPLPPGVEVYRGNRRYRYSCPIDLHPDNFKKATATKSLTPKSESNTGKGQGK
jgi:hypothetical protein